MNTKPIKIGIFGGAGYTAGELLRLLIHHPLVQIEWIHSNSHAGQAVSTVHRDLYDNIQLHFSTAITPQVNLVFLCAGHGRSKMLISEYKLDQYPIKIIDLSADFRMASAQHSFIYGLPALNKNQIKKADYIANPGCFATAIQLALLPLAKAQLLSKKEVHIQAITGSTGAGQEPKPTTHFSWRQNNVSVYKPFVHQHLAEIKQSLQQEAKESDLTINFIPIRGAFSRGIFASIYLDSKLTEAEAQQLFESYYATAPFVYLTTQNPDLKQVVNTNKCLIYLQKHQDKLFIISAIDNLLKGASGQAVQNMNLLFDFPETMGLQLKATAF
ncbi:N-acetyl-gamma-glutamyl-phosphate reductase [Aureispira anguillae]|uniref:N-acetyl-gamma-glutamyl-phosphate reductase n=1 Tax=Aureispira anguillae TaxID=2864201 RepID=A0A916DVN5_9BACT|nr:N-acetyl-gamma-glutamyl-phosphate reductase [Aureispira anguillae]BDS13917.1 N-acetyl-gamma-glutamyl-phosphate reductase [Aureispira anguillae]